MLLFPQYRGFYSYWKSPCTICGGVWSTWAWEIPSSNETYLHCQSPIGKQSHRFLVASQFWTYILIVFLACQFYFEIWSLKSRKNHTSMGWNRNGRAVAQRPGLDEGLMQTIWLGGLRPLWGLHHGPASVSQMSGALVLWPSGTLLISPRSFSLDGWRPKSLHPLPQHMCSPLQCSPCLAMQLSRPSLRALPWPGWCSSPSSKTYRSVCFFKDEVQNLFYLFFRDEVSFGGSDAVLKLGKNKSPWEPQVN